MKVIATNLSLTISDTENNRLSVVKTDKGFVFFNSPSSNRQTANMLALQNKIKAIVLKPQSSKDSYLKRFARVAKTLKAVPAPTFVKLNNALAVATVADVELTEA